MKNNLSKWILFAIIIVALIALFAGIWIFQDAGSTSIANNLSNGTNSNVSAESNITVQYTSDELAGVYTNYSAKINLSTMSLEEGNGISVSGSTITITRAGIYYFSGSTDEGNIVVNADNQEVVLVFDNVTITSSNTSVVNVMDAKKVTINIPEGTTSTFTDGSKYTVFTEDDEPNSTIFSKDDLSIDGTGTLIINANYEDAIASKDGLKIINTTIQITSADDGIRGKDYVAIKEANITINSNGKAIRATEEEDTSLGYIVIDGGTFHIESEDDAIHSKNKVIMNDGTWNISTEDDGIHADSRIFINGGTVNITKSYEGIEGNYIEINGGDITVVASDDGININGGTDTMGTRGQDVFKSISESTDETNRMLVINGGNLTVESNGDGLDSNGSITITGGTTIVGASTNGGNAALDYNGTCIVTGGSLIAYGPTGMWQNPSNTSTQYSIAFSTSGKASDKVELKDSNGNVIINFTTQRAYGMVCISSKELKQGESYTLYVNDSEVATQEITSIVTSNGISQGNFMGGGRGQMGNGDMGNFQMNGERLRETTSGDRVQFPMNDGEMPQDMQNGEKMKRPMNENGEFIMPSDDTMQDSRKGNGEKRGKREESSSTADSNTNNI